MDICNDMTGDGVLNDLHESIVLELSRALDKDQAQGMADAIVAGLAYKLAGQQVYFQMRSSYIAKLITAQFTGNNVPELVQRFRLSRGAIYKILQRERDASKSELEQCRLPGC